MRKLTSTLALAVVLSMVAFVATGCSCITDKAAEEISEEIIGGATGSDVEIDEDGESFTITSEGEDGEEITIEGGSGSSVPDEYPDDFPLYDGDVVASGSLSTAEGSMVNVSVETKDDIEDIKSFFTDAFADEGWNVLFTTEMAEGGVTTVAWTLEKGERNASVSVSVEEGVTMVNHTVLASTE